MEEASDNRCVLVRAFQPLALLLCAIGILAIASAAHAQQARLVLQATPDRAAVGDQVAFTVTVPGAGTFRPSAGQTLRIDFGDGTSSETRTGRAVHTYRQPGRYAAGAVLVFRDNVIGESNAIPIEVRLPPPAVTLVADPPTARVDEAVTMTARVDPPGDGLAYRFFAGDGRVTGSALPRASFSYAEAGRYAAYVELVQDGRVTARSARVPIEVLAPPPPPPVQVTLRARPPEAIVNVDVRFDVATSSPVDGARYVFAFGDGQRQEAGEPRVAHRYGAPGTYQATVTAFAGDARVGTSDPVVVTVLPVIPRLVLRAGAKRTTVGETLAFTAVVDPPADGDVLLFDFGDGHVLRTDAREVKHTYDGAGSFTASVRLVRGGLGDLPPATVAVVVGVPSRGTYYLGAGVLAVLAALALVALRKKKGRMARHERPEQAHPPTPPVVVLRPRIGRAEAAFAEAAPDLELEIRLRPRRGTRRMRIHVSGDPIARETRHHGSQAVT